MRLQHLLFLHPFAAQPATLMPETFVTGPGLHSKSPKRLIMTSQAKFGRVKQNLASIRAAYNEVVQEAQSLFGQLAWQPPLRPITIPQSATRG